MPEQEPAEVTPEGEPTAEEIAGVFQEIFKEALQKASKERRETLHKEISRTEEGEPTEVYSPEGLDAEVKKLCLLYGEVLASGLEDIGEVVGGILLAAHLIDLDPDEFMRRLTEKGIFLE